MSTYSTKSLYDVIKFNVLSKDKDLIHFTRTMHNLIREDFDRVKTKNYLTMHDISKLYENYTIVYMMIKGILKSINITKQDEKVIRDITDFYLTDELSKSPPPPPITSSYSDED